MSAPLQIDTWFPLAVATCDLAPTPEVTAAMREALAPSVWAASVQRRPGVAWTGDVNERGGLHQEPAFAWLRGEVERACAQFAEALGCDLTRVRLGVHDAWAVISTGEESVAVHAHAGSSVSAVYYLQVPEGEGGALVFDNVGRPNALGLALDREGAVAPNRLSQTEVAYRPREGRLVVFPSRQPLSVRPHGAETLRISITFDVVALPA